MELSCVRWLQPVHECIHISVVLTQLLRLCVSHQIATRGRDFSHWDNASVCATTGSLNLLSLGYCWCTPGWKERKVDSLIQPVGCTRGGKDLLLLTVLEENKIVRSVVRLRKINCSVDFMDGGCRGVRQPSLFWQGNFSLRMCEWSRAERKVQRKRLREKHVQNVAGGIRQ